ncbi:MAG: alginate O-acetyltransferase AlgX-related protein [Paracoccaceae bacterium]
MTRLLFATRFALPILFFGYAIFANLTVFVDRKADLVLPDTGLLSGGLTRELDGIYKNDLPHKGVSFGLIGAARYAVLGEARQGAVVGRDGWLFSAEEVRPQPTDAAMAAIVHTVQGIRAQLAAGGADLVVVPLPAKIDIYRDFSSDASFGASLERLYNAFSASLAQDGIAVVDARRALLKTAEPAFFATDTHWTPQGAHLVAAAVAMSETIKPGPLEFARVDEPTRSLTGDLIRFVTTDGFAPAIGLPPETVTPAVLTATNIEADIFGTAATDIVLVGTSYSANTDWDFANALMQALGRDVVSEAQQGLGPLTPMQAYLASAEFREAPPAVVIWEIPIRYLTDPAIWPMTDTAAPKLAALPPKENADG